MSVFVNRNDTDEHRFLSYSIICEISEICVRNILVTLMTQMNADILVDNLRNPLNLREIIFHADDADNTDFSLAKSSV